MTSLRACLSAILLSLVIMASSVMAQSGTQVDPQAKTNWEDFNHYVLIARYDLALESATALLQMQDSQALLDVVEQSDYADKWDQVLLRASKVQTLEDAAQELSRRIQNAKIERAREPDRIMQDIRNLAAGPRANMLATQRLKSAGQYAAPFLLRVLLDPAERKLQPYVLAAMVEIGRPLVYPLCEALPQLDPVPMGQIGQVLAEIGYPRALPYLRQVMESGEVDASAREMIAAAYDQISSGMGLPEDITAAELYLTLGRNLYQAASDGDQIPGYDPALDQGIVWTYNPAAGLVSIPVPADIYGDAVAIRAARDALQLNASMAPALSLLLMANSRRENNLEPGEEDLSYPSTWQPPAFYLKMAGPLRQHDVLKQALRDNDTALALDAINALNQTAGTDALVNRQAASQPLLDALSYPDRRVRFHASFAMARAHPEQQFPGSHRVVAVLSEAVRQTDLRYALVIGQNQDNVNQLNALLSDAGFTPFGGTSLEQLADEINDGPGVDLIVVDRNVEETLALYRETGMHYKLAAVPVLAIVSPGEEIELNRRTDGVTRLRSAQEAENMSDLIPAIEQAAASYAGAQIDAMEAEELALTALELLREIALAEGRSILVARDSQPALEQAVMNDQRDPVVIAAADVLSLLGNESAQQTIARAALDQTRYDEIRVAMLGSLAYSAKTHGNLLTDRQLDQLLELVRTSVGDLAEASARAHGALTLPTSNVVELLVE